MEESLETMDSRAVLHKMLDRILDSNGKENSAIWTEFIPGFCGGQAKQITYRLSIEASREVTYTEL